MSVVQKVQAIQTEVQNKIESRFKNAFSNLEVTQLVRSRFDEEFPILTYDEIHDYISDLLEESQGSESLELGKLLGFLQNWEQTLRI